MRNLFGRLGLRWGLALVIGVLVVGVVAVARLAGNRESPSYTSPEFPTFSVDPSAGDDGVVAATPSAYPDNAAVRAAATAFTKAWLRRGQPAAAWHAALAERATPALADRLEGVDPSTVPATRTTGEPTIALRADTYAQVRTPVDSGTLVLGLVRQGDRWVVDSVDWERA